MLNNIHTVQASANNSAGFPQMRQKADKVNPAAQAFTSYMLEKTINDATINGNVDIDGIAKSRGEILARQMMNRQIADTIAKHSDITIQISKELNR